MQTTPAPATPTRSTADGPDAGMIEISARRGEHHVRVYARPDGNARALTRQLTLALLANLGEISLPDDPDESAFANPHDLDGLHAFVLSPARTSTQAQSDALVFCPTCSLGGAASVAFAQRTWADLDYQAGDRLTICVTAERFADLRDSASASASASAAANGEGEEEGASA